MYAGGDWAGEYSRWTFDETKQYVMVAKEMRNPVTGEGVCLLDCELNEQAEINITYLRRFIQRTFGDGTNGTGFRIDQSATNTVNNFTIKGGDGTADGAGYIFVKGWMPINLSDLEYTAQSDVPTLNTPTTSRTDEIYLDVYFEECGPLQDPDIIDPLLGSETSRRIKLAWTVFVAEGESTPADGLDGNGVFHWRYKLATIVRPSGNSYITSSIITDTRNSGRVNPAGTRTYSGNPTGLIAPNFLGEEMLDTVGHNYYKAIGTGVSDWKKIT